MIVVASALYPYPYSSELIGETLARRAGVAKKSSSSMREVSEKAVRHSPVPRATTVCSDRTDLADRVNEFLRRKYPVKVGECVGADLGIKATTVQKWMERTSAPSSWMLLKMVSAYGPEFLAAVMGDAAPEWLHASAHTERRARIAADIQKLQAELDAI